jgi:predicted DNA-binding protein (MmcQ/YjbR family)
VTSSSLAEDARAFAAGLPEAWEDHPWGESVFKVGKKVFVFFGEDVPDRPFGFTVKLPESNAQALALPWVVPPGYGLDRGGWVSATPPDDIPFDLVAEWIEESYRAVAPRKLAAQLAPR